MLSIMSRYKWRQLGILTSEIAGHDDFVQAVRDQITAAKADDGRYVIQSALVHVFCVCPLNETLSVVVHDGLLPAKGDQGS